MAERSNVPTFNLQPATFNPSGETAGGLDLRIDELVLHGFRPADRYAIAAALERELGRLFNEGGMLPALLDRGRMEGGLDAYRLDAGSFAVPHDATPDAVGVQVARAIHRGLGGAPAAGSGAGQRSRGEPRAGGAH